MEVAADSQLLHLELVAPAAFRGAGKGVIDRVIEIEDVAGIDPELAGEDFRVERRFLGAAVAVEPGEVGEGEGLRGAGGRRRFGILGRRRNGGRGAPLCNS